MRPRGSYQPATADLAPRPARMRGCASEGLTEADIDLDRKQAVNFAFGGPDLNFGNGRGFGVLSSRSAQLHGKGIMLGRHVYRVHPTDQGWTLTKEGEDHPRADFPGREDAIAGAVRLAEADEPAKVIIDNGNGTITDEWLFGADSVDELKI